MKTLFKKNQWILKFLFLCSFCLICGFSGVSAQERTVSGTVVDQGNNPLPGASVIIQGTRIGTVTDIDGNYSLTVPSDDVILEFTFVGYSAQQVMVGDQTVIDVVLVETTTALDEIIVVGYGSQSRALLSASISRVDDNVLQNVPFASVGDALQGTLSGLRIQRVHGQPGSDPRIQMRGGTSIDSPGPSGAGPLIVIDGVIRDNYRDVNPRDIESIQLLKDSEAAIYGARSSNGVLVITTKRGRAGVMDINYSGSVGMAQQQRRVPYVNARDYLFYRRIGSVNLANSHPDRAATAENQLWGSSPWGTGNDLTNATNSNVMLLTDDNRWLLNEGWETMEDPISDETIIFKNTDWQDVLFRNAMSQNHNLSISGGTETATFRASIGYLNEDGIAIHTNYERLSFTGAGDLRVSDNFSLNTNITLSHRTDQHPYNYNQIFQRSMDMAPTRKYRNPDGSLNTSGSRGMGNPEYFMQTQESDRGETRANFTLGLDYEPIEGLNIRPQVSLFKQDRLRNEFTRSHFSGTRLVDSRGASADYNLQWRRQGDLIVNYRRTFADLHNFSADAIGTYFDDQYYTLGASGRGAGTDNVPTLNAIAERTRATSSHSQLRILGLVGRVRYDYNRKYIFSASIRRDGASNLGADSRWANFPAASVGWNLHNEDFWQPIGPIGRLQVRTSYGVTGNIEGLGRYESQGSFALTQNYAGAPAVINNQLANPGLKWERSTTFNAGFDMALFNNRLEMFLDVFSRETDELLTNVALPRSTGFTTVKTNLGALRNRGVELEISGNIIDTPGGFSLGMNFNATYIETIIKQLPYNGLENNRIGGIQVWDRDQQKYIWVEGRQEGKRMGDLYGFLMEGVYQTDAEAANAPHDTYVASAFKDKVAGDVIWGDIDGNDTINLRDAVYMGNEFPNWIGGLSINAGYRGLSLYVRTDYALGHTVVDVLQARSLGNAQGGINATELILESWLQEGDDTRVGRPITIDQWGPFNHIRTYWDRQGEIHYKRGDYLALREVTLAYVLPEIGFLSTAGIARARINLTGYNLGYLLRDDFGHFNPELGGYYTAGIYPQSRTFMIGLDVSF